MNKSGENKKSKISVIFKGLLVVFLVYIVFLLSSYEVQENEYACVKRFSKVVSIKSDAGLAFKIPFIDIVQRLPKTQMYYDLQPSDVLTSDKKSLVVDSYIIWTIKDPLTFIKTINYVSEMERRLDTATYSSIKNNISQIPQAQMIALSDNLLEEVNSTIQELDEATNNNTTNVKVDTNTSKRDKLNDDILEDVNRQITPYGVEAKFVEIKRLDLPEANEGAVYTRMISERNRIAKGYTADGKSAAEKIKNETNKKAENIIAEAQGKAQIIKGQGETEAMRILKETYNNPQKASFYEFVKSLEALENSVTGEEKTIILSKDSPLANIFLQEK